MKIKNIDQEIELQFWYPAVVIETNAKKKLQIVPVSATGHIMHEGRIMCRSTIKSLLEEVPNATTFVIKSARIEQNPLCPKCIKVYKKADWSPWKKWEEGVKHAGQPSK